MRRLSFALSIAFVLGTVSGVDAQEVPEPKFNSPFSRFGVGDIAPHTYVAQEGMGGIGIAYAHSHIASPTNPAAIGALRFASYQFSVAGERSTLSSGDLETDNTTGNLQYISLAFPLQNSLQRVLDGKLSKWRNSMLLSLSPYSTVGYDVQTSSRIAELGEVRSNFRGSGDYYRLQWGNAVEYDNIARAGINLSYIFGRKNTQELVLPLDALGATFLSDTDALRVRGIELQLGGQYDFILEREESGVTKKLTVGAMATLPVTLKGETSAFTTSTTTIFNSPTVDTLTFETIENQEVRLPAHFGVGVFYRHTNVWAIGVDVTQVNWSSYRTTIRPDERLTDATRINAGVEWTPNFKAYGKYWQRVQYRAGVYTHGDPRPGLESERGVTFGVGLPVVRPREETSYVNLALNSGRISSTGDIMQRYFRLSVGFTLTDNSWFYKRRFN